MIIFKNWKTSAVSTTDWCRRSELRSYQSSNVIENIKCLARCVQPYKHHRPACYTAAAVVDEFPFPRQQGLMRLHPPGTNVLLLISDTCLQFYEEPGTTYTIWISGGSSWKLPWKQWKLPWKLPSTLPWKILWKLKFFVEVSTEVTTTEASVKASTEVTSTETSSEAFTEVFTEDFTDALTEAFVEVNLLPRKLSRELSRELSYK